MLSQPYVTIVDYQRTCETSTGVAGHAYYVVVPEETEPSGALKKLIDQGAALVGAVGPAALGLASASPEVALAASAGSFAVQQAMHRVGGDIAQRILAPRERVRIGATFTYAEQTIREMLFREQAAVRDDGFFDAVGGDRSAGDELVEGVLLTAAREYEERKLPYLGAMIGKVPFHPELDRGSVARWLELGRRLSYRQLCLLSLVAQKEEFNLPTEDEYTHPASRLTWEQGGVRHDLADLGYAKLDLVGSEREADGNEPSPRLGLKLTGHIYSTPARLQCMNEGGLLAYLMNLDRIPRGDLEHLAAVLRLEA